MNLFENWFKTDNLHWICTQNHVFELFWGQNFFQRGLQNCTFRHNKFGVKNLWYLKEKSCEMSRWEHLWWSVEGVGISGFKINWDCRKSRSELWIHCNECSLSVVEYLFPSLLWIVQMLFRMRWRSLAHTMKAYCSISQQHKFVQRIWLLGARFSRAEMTRPCFKALVILYFVVTVNSS